MFEDLPQFVLRNVCLSCDECCHFKEQDSCWRPKIAKEEISDVEGAAEIYVQAVDENGYLKTAERGSQFHCTFFHKRNCVCSIYPHRPFECRLYPFLMTKKDGKFFISVHLSCPHIQKHWGGHIIEDFIEELKEYFNRKDVLEFVQRNPELFGEYLSYEQEIEHLFVLA